MKNQKLLKHLKFTPLLVLTIPAIIIFTLNVMQIYADNNTISTNISFVNNCYIHSRYRDTTRDRTYVVELSFDDERDKTYTYDLSIKLGNVYETGDARWLYSAIHQNIPVEKIVVTADIPYYIAKEHNIIEINNGIKCISTYQLLQQDEEFIEEWVYLSSIQAELY